MNSPIAWWYSWRLAQHAKDEALRLFNTFIESFPIPDATEVIRSVTDSLINKLVTIAELQFEVRESLADWLNVQFEILDPSMKLRDLVSLDSNSFISEVQKSRGKSKELTSAALKQLREEHKRTIEPARALAAEARALEARVSDLVNAAYGLTPDEVRLMWDTAPPRMPIPRPDLP